MTALFDALDAVPTDVFVAACGLVLLVVALVERIVMGRAK